MIDALISGKLIKTPELKTGKTGSYYTQFLLSVDVGEEKPVVVSGMAFAEIAERVARLQKGDPLAVVPEDHAAPEPPRRRRRLHVRFHPDGRRVRDALPCRWGDRLRRARGRREMGQYSATSITHQTADLPSVWPL